MKRPVTFLLIAINIGLAFILAWLWFSPTGQRASRWEAPSAIKPQLTSTRVSLAGSSSGDGGLAAMQERPIFSATRRPISAASAPVVARADPLDSVRLYGVFAGSDGGGVIVGSEGKTRRLKISDVLGDWRLEKVRDKEAVFVRGAETRVIALVQVKQGQVARPPSSLPEMMRVPLGLPNPPQLTPVPQPPSVVAQPPPAVAASPKPAASSTKPSPGFLIGGSR